MRALNKKKAVRNWSAIHHEDQEDQPQTKRLKKPRQLTELTNLPEEIVPPVTSAPLAPNDSPHEVLPQQQQAKVMRIGSVEYTTEQSVFTDPALARELISQMVLPHDCDSVAQRDTLDMAQELMCQAMEVTFLPIFSTLVETLCFIFANLFVAECHLENGGVSKVGQDGW